LPPLSLYLFQQYLVFTKGTQALYETLQNRSSNPV